MTAVYVGSECCSSLVDRDTNGEVQLIYVSPKAIFSVPTWREMFQNQHYLIYPAVDEAHLIERCVLFTFAIDSGVPFHYLCMCIHVLGSIVMCGLKSC